MFYHCPLPRGASRPFPERPPLAESFIGARFSPASRRAVVWEGRGATARPREAKWSSGVAGVFWVCQNKNKNKKDPYMYVTMYYEFHYRGALYNKDFYVRISIV